MSTVNPEIEVHPLDLVNVHITNCVFDVVAPDNKEPYAELGVYKRKLTPVLVATAVRRPTFRLQKLDNGAYHVFLPDVQGKERFVVASNNKLYAQEAVGDSNTKIIQEWEVLSTARGGTSPKDDTLSGFYMIAVRGEPRMVWTLLHGETGSQVDVVDIFTADGPDSYPSERPRAMKNKELNWKPRRWLWQIEKELV